ncbi:MAG: ABC transporter ATP-binding protein [Verrucomicrobiota bacterium]
MTRPSTTQPILSLKNLCLERDSNQILKDIQWTVNTGEHWAIMGANGSGKSSLLATLTAYLSPNSGSIHLLGEDYGNADWQAVRERIGIVSSSLTRRVPSDEPAIETVLSGATAQLGYWTRERTVDNTKALRCLSKLKIRKLANRLWGILSQGERQKVFIARALMADPKLLILDEPCAGLDPVAREHFLQSLQNLAQSRKAPALIFVTHHIEEIFPEISHVLLLKNGKVLAQGPKAEILNSSLLSAALGAPITVRKQPKAERWTIKLN